MLSDQKHWLKAGLALLVSFGGAVVDRTYGQVPQFGSDTPTSASFPGPAPMGCDSSNGCDSYSDAGQGLFGTGLLRGPMGGRLGNSLYGSGHPAYGCGPMGCTDDGLLGSGLLGRGLLGGGACASGSCGQSGLLGANGCGACGGAGCGACGGSCGGAGCIGCGAGCFGVEGALLSGQLVSRLLGPLAPYSEGAGSQRWFDLYAGTIAWARSSDIGAVTSTALTTVQNPDGTVQLVAGSTDIISTLGPGIGSPVLRSTSLNLDELRYGLELVGNIQTGPGANVEVRYFGLNSWNDTLTARSDAPPNLFSIFSDYGTNPVGGFDDTDQSFIHTISLDSKFDNGEVNFRRRWVGYNSAIQGSWMGGVRYFELDENFGFDAVGSNNNTFTFDQLRFFNMDTGTRNHLVGFQLGGDVWVNVIPGIAIGNDFRAGVYNNQSKVETLVVANSVPGASEVIRKESAAFLIEYSLQAVYRLTYSWSFRGAYNLMYVDEVALAHQNFNPRDMSNALNNSVFGINRLPFINADGHAFYQGYSIGAEFLW